MKLVKRALSALFYIVFLCSIVMILFPEFSMNLFGMRPYRVITESMEPKIQTTDIFLIRKRKVEDIKVGDIITFETHVINNDKVVNITVSHYVYDVKDGKFLTQDYTAYDEGRGNYDKWVNSDGEEQPWISGDKVIGVHWFTIPLIGSISNELNKIIIDEIMLLLILVIIILIFFMAFLMVAPPEKECKPCRTISQTRINRRIILLEKERKPGRRVNRTSRFRKRILK